MSNRIREVIQKLQAEKKIGLMGHIIAGFPDDQGALAAGTAICEAGAHFLEVQFPFSDPTADGPVIEGACYQAIHQGFTAEKGFNLVKALAGKTETVVLIMTYANIIYSYGIEKFIRQAKSCGAHGLIIPDLPAEQDEGLNQLCRDHEIANIIVAAPGASGERIRMLSEIGSGFLYTVARRGITGDKSVINEETTSWLTLVKNHSRLPVAVGFGIRTKEQLDQLKPFCDLGVIGSHFVSLIQDAINKGADIRQTLLNEVKILLE